MDHAVAEYPCRDVLPGFRAHERWGALRTDYPAGANRLSVAVSMELWFGDCCMFFASCILCAMVMQAHYTEREARDVIASLADALSYMHAKKIAHRDLKVGGLSILGAAV